MSDNSSRNVDRANSLIDLYRQARHRFDDLEKLYWKVNFSIWGFFGAVVYVLRGQNNQPAAHLGWWTLLLAVAVPIHFEFLRRINNSQSGWRSTAEHYRDRALLLLDQPQPKQPGRRDVQRNDQVWTLLAPTTTLLIAGVVMRLFW